VKNWATTLATLPLLSASLALAEDFKMIDGKVYKNATISRVEADGIVLRTKTGIYKIYFVEVPKDIQERFHYAAATPIAAQREREPIKAEAKQESLRGLTRGGGQGRCQFRLFPKSIKSGGAYHHRGSIGNRAYSFSMTSNTEQPN
jgi:hypothetical protein